MQYRITLSLVLLICVALAITGCTGTQNAPAAPATAAPSSSPGSGSSPANLVPVPTDTLTGDYGVTIDVGEKDYLGNIPVIFQGGKGQIHVTKIDVKLTRSDGVVKNV